MTAMSVSFAHLPSLLPATDRVAGVLIAAVWQGSALVAAVALCLRLLPRLSPAVRTRLWLGVLLLLVLLPMVLLLPTHGEARTAAAPVHLRATWSLWLVAAWAVLSMARAVKLLASAWRLRRIALAARPVDLPSGMGPEFGAMLWRGRQAVELCLSAEVGRPSVVGFARPRILLPPELYAALSAHELRQVVLHEMEHLRRHDDWTNLLQKLALVALPLHPALFWVERRLCLERELACDDGVLRATAARKAYAACLVSLAEHSILRRGTTLALGAWERQSELVRRVHRILRRPEATVRPAVARVTAVAVLGGVLAGGGLLAGSPQLVSFVPGPEVAQAEPAHMPGMVRAATPAMLPVVGRVAQAAGGGHLTLVAAARMPASAGAERRAVSRPAVREGAAGRGEPAMRRVIRHVDRPAPRWMVLTSWEGAVRVPVLTLAVDDDILPTYAAVPMRGGWLFVQL